MDSGSVNTYFMMLDKDTKVDSESLILANKELAVQIKENEKRETELKSTNKQLKDAEAAIRKLNEVLEKKVIKRSAQYAFISQINQAIVQVKDEKTLFHQACSIACEFGKFNMAWIGHFDPANKKISLIDSSGIAAEDIPLFTAVRFGINGPQDKLLGGEKYFLCNDIDQSVELESWRPFAAKHGIRSCIILPLKKWGILVGTFNLYASELNFFDTEDIKLAVEATFDISFALDLFEKAKKQKESEALIQMNERRFRLLIEHGEDMILLSSALGKVIYGSPSITKILGYSTSEILESSSFQFIHPDDLVAYKNGRTNLVQHPGESYNCEIRLKHKNGEWKWCESTITNRLHDIGIHAMVSNFRDITEKRATVTRQGFDNKNLNALINNTRDMMWSVDRNFNLITSNAPFKNFIMLMSGETIEKGDSVFSKAFSKEQLSRFRIYYERAFAGEIFNEIEYTEFPVESWQEISYYPIGDGDEIIGTACHTRDISAVKKADIELSKSEAFSRGVLDALNSHIAVLDAAGIIVTVNASWKDFAKENGDHNLVHTSEGINYFDVCEKAGNSGNEIAFQALQGMKATMNGGEKHFYLEYPCHAPNHQRWFGMRAIKFENEVPMIIVVHTDVTMRKIAEQNLIQSEARLKEAQALSHISNWEINLITGKNTWSDEFYVIFGFKPDEIEASQDVFLSLVHPDDFEFVREAMAQSLQKMNASSFSARIIRKDGNIRYIVSEWKFEFDTYNKAVRLFGVLQDITDRKLAEQEREKLTNDLILRNQALEQFTFIISHNLRAPTANIIGFTDILQDETLTPSEKSEILQGISKSVLVLDSVIKDINSILQVKTEVNERKELISFSALVVDISTALGIGNPLDKKHIQIQSDFSEVDELFSLKAYVYSIFYNLISNSVKYSKPDMPSEIEIKSRKSDHTIILTFKDNGLGFDKKTKGDQVFGLYKRFHSHVGGKGMGLFMVKTQLEAIGGSISAESELNEGALFTLVFTT